MPGIIHPDNEASRLEALHALSIMGTDRQAELDAVVETIAEIFECKTALVSLIDANHQWFKACVGIDFFSTPRDQAFCQHTILSSDMMIIPDALLDPRFADNPLVIAGPRIRFYAGTPLSLDGEHRLGTLCVINDEPMQPSDQQLAHLRRMAKVVESLLVAHDTSNQLRVALEQAQRAEQVALQQRELLDEVTCVSGVGGWKLDVVNDVLTWTDKTREIHEVGPDYTPTIEEALEFYPSGSREVVAAAIDKAAATGIGWDLELPFTTAKGREIWIRAAGRPVYEGTEIVRFVGSFQDITERKRQSEMVQAIFDNFPGALAYHAEDLRLLACNNAFRDFFRFPEEMIQQQLPMLDYMVYLAERGDYGPGDPLTLARERYEKTYAQKSEAVMERVTADGQVMETRLTRLPNGNNLISFLDITTRKQAERSLRCSEAIQRTTLESVSEGVLVLSGEGTIISVNPAGETLLGVPDGTLTGSRVQDLKLRFTYESGEVAKESNLFTLALSEPSRLIDLIVCVEHDLTSERVWLSVDTARVDAASEFDSGLVVITLTDITKNKAQLDTLQAIVNHMPGGLVYYDQDKRLAVCNDEFRQLLSLPKSLIDEKPELETVTRYLAHRGDYGPENPEQMMSLKLSALQQTEPYIRERKGPDGRDLEVRGVMLPDGSVVSSVFDITDRKQLEKLAAQREEDLRQHAAQVTAILTNMSQGVSVFNSDGELMFWNERYIELFEKPGNEIRTGVSLSELLMAEQERGEFDGDPEQHVCDLLERMKAGEVVCEQFTHPNGKVIKAVHAPMPEGGWVGTHEDVTEQEQAAAKIKFAAHHDDLTGLANRSLFNASLEKTLEAAAAKGKCSHLLMIDLDRFKPVNDTYGHGVGDDILKQVGERLKDCVRDSDLIARLGGDEFAIILAGLDPENTVVSRIAASIVSTLGTPFRSSEHTVTIGASIGIAVVTPDNSPEPETVIKRADVALYQAKDLGRNRFCFYEPEDTDRHRLVIAG